MRDTPLVQEKLITLNCVYDFLLFFKVSVTHHSGSSAIAVTSYRENWLLWIICCLGNWLDIKKWNMHTKPWWKVSTLGTYLNLTFFTVFQKYGAYTIFRSHFCLTFFHMKYWLWMQQCSGHFLAFLRLLSLVSNNSSITLN